MASVPSAAPYRTRRISWLGVDRHDGRAVKNYGIALNDGEIGAAAAAAGRSLARRLVPSPLVQTDRYGVGFAVVHEGRHAIWTLIHWWRDEDALEQRMWRAPLGRPEEARAHDEAVIGCTWELAVVSHERDAWVREVLMGPGDGRLERYLEATFEGPA